MKKLKQLIQGIKAEREADAAIVAKINKLEGGMVDMLTHQANRKESIRAVL